LVVLALPGHAAAQQQPYLGFNEAPAPSGSAGVVEIADLSHAALGSGGVVRFGVSWRSVEGSGWGAVDELYAALEARGLRALPIVTDAPRSTNPLCMAPPCPPAPAHYGGWAQFVSEVARRYPGSVAIEVWNEPNKRGSWNTLLGPDPRHYAEVFRVAAAAVHSVDPTMPVLVAALAQVSKDVLGHDQTLRTFLSRFYAAGGGGALAPGDGLSVHPYPGRYELTPEKLSDPASAMSKYLGDVREIRDARDPQGSARALWVTEVGWSMTGLRAVTESQQAQGLVNVLDVLGAMSDVRSVLVHRLADPPPAVGRPVSELGFGVVRRNLAPKQSYCAIAAKLGRPVPAGCG
jgi:hypothetical protein